MMAAGRISYGGLTIGQTVAFGRLEVTKDEIIHFARAFDPQPFHLSEEAAKDSNIGRLIASGYHTCALLMRLIVDHALDPKLSLGAPGVEEVRFLKPVFPGDTLSARYSCKDKRELKSRPGVGAARFLFELINGGGEIVMTWDSTIFIRLQPHAAEGAARS
jgi:acyl dehydratase